jgi:hypothetical protein
MVLSDLFVGKGTLSMKRMRTRWQVRSGVLLALMSFGLSGYSQPGSVSGKVTLQGGEALSSGMVVFVDKDGKVSQPAGIEVDGSYAATNVPLGHVTACVETLPLSGGDGGGPNAVKGQPRPRYVPILEKYKDAKQSGLTLEVKPGANVYNIEVQRKR